VCLKPLGFVDTEALGEITAKPKNERRIQMKVKLDPMDYESKSLSWLCIKPMLLAVRGKDFSAKSEMYNQLNEGQKGLYLFYSFHNHTKTLEEFYWFSAYHINELKSWNGIKKD
jgi:hypothetical protein